MSHELTRVAESLKNKPPSQLTREETLGVMSDAPTPGTQPGESALETAKKLRVKWYRSPVDREDLARLNKRSDLLGFAQTLGYLAVLVTSCSVTIYSFVHWPWYVTALLVLLHGHSWHFLINGFHELIHDSVFKTRALNRLFVRIFSFLGWYNHHHFWASHTEHHKYTMHLPEDMEVVQPEYFSRKELLSTALVYWKWPLIALRTHLYPALGRIPPDDKWTATLFPESEPARQRKYFNWSRIVLLGHGLIAGVAVASGWWIVLLVFTCPMLFGRWLFFLCNSSQHVGLCDDVSDFRLCCRTIYLIRPLQFLYWHMNYHTEHHMYAAVPCYHLGKLHRLIKKDLPHCPNGLIETWKQIFEIQDRQQMNPSYRYVPELPTGGIDDGLKFGK
jgi:fatty acid desaturase